MWTADFTCGGCKALKGSRVKALKRQPFRESFRFNPSTLQRFNAQMKIDDQITPRKLVRNIERVFELSAHKILSLEKTWKPAAGAPVVTVKGRYATRGWTEWTQGFQFGSALLQFDAIDDERFLEIGRRNTIGRMAPHVSHIGVHDHG